MKITINPVMDMETLEIVSSGGVYEYSGPVMLFDRAAAHTARAAADTANTVGAQKGSDASQVGGALIPGLERQAANPVGYTPQQMNNQLVAGEQGAGGAASSITGEAGLQATRTRNAGGYGAALDEAARIKGRGLSQNALDVHAKSDELGQKKQQFAQSELGGIYGMDTNAMLHAMGLVPEDLKAAAANNTNWTEGFKNVMEGLKMGAQGAQAGRQAAG